LTVEFVEVSVIVRDPVKSSPTSLVKPRMVAVPESCGGTFFEPTGTQTQSLLVGTRDSDQLPTVDHASLFAPDQVIVQDGGAPVVRVKAWVAAVPTPLEAVMVIG
jgi:hypothetical protein